MKKKILITSAIILLIFIVGVILPLLFSKKSRLPSPTPAISQEKAAQQTHDDFTAAQAIEEIHSDYPWYSKIPIETPDYRIIFDFA